MHRLGKVETISVALICSYTISMSRPQKVACISINVER